MTVTELVKRLLEQFTSVGDVDVLLMADDIPIADFGGPDLLCQIRLVEYHEDEQGGFVVLES